ATADAEKSAEIDDRRLGLSGSIHNDIDDPPHVFIGGATDLLAENALDFLVVENSDGWLSREPARGPPTRGVWRLLALRLRRGIISNCRINGSGEHDQRD